MNDILPPKRPIASPRPVPTPSVPDTSPKEQVLLEEPISPPLLEASKKRSGWKWILGSIAALAALLILMGGGFVVWYQMQLQPLAPDDTSKIRVEILSGSSPTQIGRLLEEKKVIRSSTAFDVYTRISGTRGSLQAGTYSLSPSETVEQVVGHLVAGKTDEFVITFLPGATLAENRTALIRSGYKETEVDAALNKTYDHPLFVDKPAGTDLEGYIYGETYHFDSTATVEQILTKTFDEYYEQLIDHQLIEVIRQRGLNLYQGITLASIIQREVPGATDQKQVAQVFFTRLAQDMPLGSDVTYQYAAKKLGVAPSPSLESPYNTRKYPGLPPGPIATPGLSALQAVATPAAGDYVFFLSGDDDKTYFSRTVEEHEANIRDHCQVKCLLP